MAAELAAASTKLHEASSSLEQLSKSFLDRIQILESENASLRLAFTTKEELMKSQSAVWIANDNKLQSKNRDLGKALEAANSQLTAQQSQKHELEIRLQDLIKQLETTTSKPLTPPTSPKSDPIVNQEEEALFKRVTDVMQEFTETIHKQIMMAEALIHKHIRFDSSQSQVPKPSAYSGLAGSVTDFFAKIDAVKPADSPSSTTLRAFRRLAIIHIEASAIRADSLHTAADRIVAQQTQSQS